MLRLLRFQARRDRRQLLIWVLAIGLLVAGTANAIQGEFPTEADRTGLLRLALVTPALLALRGAPSGSGEGSVLFFQLFSWMAVVVGLLNTFLSTRHGRADEEQGRRELLGATGTTRTAPVAATLMLGTLVDLAVAVVSWLALVALGFDPYGAGVAGLALGVTGFAFLGVGLLANQLTASSRAANALAGGLVGVAYALRASGDALGRADLTALSLQSAWPSWLSPIGWGQQTFAMSDNRLLPLLPGLALGVLGAAAALAVQSRRDLGHSLLAVRPGRTSASPLLHSQLGLTWRLQWPAVLGWTVGGALLGLFTGSLAGAVSQADLVNPQVTEVLASLAPGGGTDLVSLIIGAVVGLVCLLAAAAGVQSVLRLRADETDGGAELVLASPLSRRVWLLDAVLVGALSVLAVVAGVALAAALSFLAADDPRHAGVAAEQALVGAPAALVFVGLTAALVVVVPRVAVGLAWGLFSLAAALGLLSGLLRVPDRVADLSPFSHVPAVPVQHGGPLVAMLVVAVVLTGAATLALRRRDLSP